MPASDLNRQVARNAREFSTQLLRLGDFIIGDVNQIIRKSTLDLWSAIVESTPHDTGRAKNNWSIDTRHTQEVYEAGRQYSPHMSFNPDINAPVIYIYNNLEYIVPLEEGHSQQAPRGMVAVNLARFTDHFTSEAQRMGYR